MCSFDPLDSRSLEKLPLRHGPIRSGDGAFFWIAPAARGIRPIPREISILRPNAKKAPATEW